MAAVSVFAEPVPAELTVVLGGAEPVVLPADPVVVLLPADPEVVLPDDVEPEPAVLSLFRPQPDRARIARAIATVSP